MAPHDAIAEPGWTVPVVGRSDLVVVGGGPAGIAAAVAGARNGLSVTLVERYPYLGGLASGGMVLVLDDMCNGDEISVRGLCGEMIERMERIGLCVVPPESERRSDPDAVAQMVAVGRLRLQLASKASADLLRRSLRSRRIQARRQRDGRGSQSRAAGCIAGFPAPSSRMAASPALFARRRAGARRSWARSSSTRAAISTWRPPPARPSPTAPTS